MEIIKPLPGIMPEIWDMITIFLFGRDAIILHWSKRLEKLERKATSLHIKIEFEKQWGGK